MTRTFPGLTLIAALALAFLGLSAPAFAACQFGKVGEFKIVLNGTQPLIPSEINGQKVFLMIDTGASGNTLLRSQAAKLGVKGIEVDGVEMLGVGGRSRVNSTIVKEVKLGDLTLPNFGFLISGESASLGRTADGKDVVGVIGAAAFSRFDMELDFADGFVRFFKATDCKNDVLAYWGGSFSVSPIKPVSSENPHFNVQIALNGHRMDAILDTGAAESVVTTDAALRAGLPTNNPKVRPIGSSGGFGKERVRTWLGTFDSFGIGDETIKNAKLQIADLFGADAEVETGSRVASRPENTPSMLLGADFFRSHRVMIANSQGKVYFSYKGGPVFALYDDAPDKPAP